MVASEMVNRNSKQCVRTLPGPLRSPELARRRSDAVSFDCLSNRCRERWLNHLDPRVRKGEWSAEEEEIFIDAHKRLGNSWCDHIASTPWHHCPRTRACAHHVQCRRLPQVRNREVPARALGQQRQEPLELGAATNGRLIHAQAGRWG